MKSRKVPLRRCVACGEQREKKELLRMVRTPQGEILIDDSGRKNGRGAYLCKSLGCLTLAKKKHSLERAWKIPVEDAVYESLKEELKKLGS